MRDVIGAVVLITFFTALSAFFLWVAQVTIFTGAGVILMMIANALIGAAGWEAWFKYRVGVSVDRILMEIPEN